MFEKIHGDGSVTELTTTTELHTSDIIFGLLENNMVSHNGVGDNKCKFCNSFEITKDLIFKDLTNNNIKFFKIICYACNKSYIAFNIQE
jgi:hypothetical protein